MSKAAGHFVVVMALVGLLLWPQTLWACPFCNAASQTLSEEMGEADTVVFARLIESPKPREPEEGFRPSVELSKFKVTRVLIGDEHAKVGSTIETLHFGEFGPDTTFLLIGTLLPDMQWSTPIPMSKRSMDYIAKLPTLPPDGADRLVFFQEYLEDDDLVLAQDAYDEFAKAPYSAVKELKDRMQRERLLKWIQDPDVSPSNRRLYFTLLGVCGGADDVPLLEKMIKSDDRRMKSGLDALIACYLTLKGPEGMPLIEDQFLKNTDAEYADTYAAVMAIRFHGEESDVIDRERLLAALRHMLDRPELADLVISDLARWEDWSVMDQLVKLFKEADESTSWVRVPVVNYLLVCGMQQNDTGRQALATIEELKKIDPSAIKQARSYGAFGILSSKSKVAPGSAAEGQPAAPARADGKAGDDAQLASTPAAKAEAKPTSTATEPEDEPAEAATASADGEQSPSRDSKKVMLALLVGVMALVALRLAIRK